jgi:hypothetical protein
MGRKPNLSIEMVDAVREVTRNTKDARGLRRAMFREREGRVDKPVVRE